jgi:hypothetical protein
MRFEASLQRRAERGVGVVRVDVAGQEQEFFLQGPAAFHAETADDAAEGSGLEIGFTGEGAGPAVTSRSTSPATLAPRLNWR